MATAANNGLKELHRLHVRLQEIRDQLQRGPRQVERREQFAEQKRQEIEAAKKQLKQLKMSIDEKSLQLKTNESKISELRTKLNSAGSNREFDIIKSQIDADRMANSVLEDEILEMLEKADQMQTQIQAAQAEHMHAISEARRTSEEVAAAEPGLKEKSLVLEKELRAAEEGLPSQIMDNYRRLVQAHGAGALASVENKACTACFAILAPNQLVELNTGKPILCRSCGRLLYIPGEESSP